MSENWHFQIHKVSNNLALSTLSQEAPEQCSLPKWRHKPRKEDGVGPRKMDANTAEQQEYPLGGVPLVAQQWWTGLVSMRTQVHPWLRAQWAKDPELQTQLRSSVAVAVVYASSYSSDLTPSYMQQVQPRGGKKKKKEYSLEELRVPGWQLQLDP